MKIDRIETVLDVAVQSNQLDHGHGHDSAETMPSIQSTPQTGQEDGDRGSEERLQIHVQLEETEIIAVPGEHDAEREIAQQSYPCRRSLVRRHGSCDQRTDEEPGGGQKMNNPIYGAPGLANNDRNPAAPGSAVGTTAYPNCDSP